MKDLLDVLGVEVELLFVHSHRLAAPHKIVVWLQTGGKISSTEIFISSFLFIFKRLLLLP